jgi:hypothetical protein
MPNLTEDYATIEIYIDADNNAATGNEKGFECLFGLDKGGWYFGAWDGSKYDRNSADAMAFRVTYLNGFLSGTMDAGECNLTNHIGFAVASYRGSDPENPIIDTAPDSGLYDYVLSTAAPAAQRFAIATSTPQPHSSSIFMVTAFGATFTDGTGASSSA